MPQFKLSDITKPFWSSNDGFKGGRDPMGIQNSSVSTYGKLLPGLTNLTGHIRYYSLYCWLLSEYDILETQKQTEVYQYNFIRRAELAMALIMKDQNVGSVVGALFVSQQRYKVIEDNLYDLEDGGDYESEDKYWTYPTGAFGQYYLGSLIYYNLVKIEPGRYYLLNDGKELANAVRNSVDKTIRNLFIECINEGAMSEDEREMLLPLGLNKLKIHSEEWNSLNYLLIKRDDDSSLRRETVQLMLNDLDHGIPVNKFVEHRFLNYVKDSESEAAFGWYFYYLCEAFHYCIETIFCFILNEIDDLSTPSVRVLIEDIKNKTLSCLKNEQKYHSLNEWKDNVSGDIAEMYNELKNLIITKDYPNAVAQAIYLLLRLQIEYELNKTIIIKFENKNDLINQRGIISNGLKSYIVNHYNLSIPNYIEKIVQQIMQEHTIVAISKMGNSETDLRKFIFEDGKVVLVEMRYPTETSPRIVSLYNFLLDLGYVDSEGNLTDIAKNYIKNYGND
ncbi:hypothetical protein SAMN02910409_2228 [Prevotellaceae bacterium HUN156]|nr:hypothetical protein SAMN02910409_2228 [Prevotellaceae bacterium HUN156]